MNNSFVLFTHRIKKTSVSVSGFSLCEENIPSFSRQCSRSDSWIFSLSLILQRDYRITIWNIFILVYWLRWWFHGVAVIIPALHICHAEGPGFEHQRNHILNGAAHCEWLCCGLNKGLAWSSRTRCRCDGVSSTIGGAKWWRSNTSEMSGRTGMILNESFCDLQKRMKLLLLLNGKYYHI